MANNEIHVGDFNTDYVVPIYDDEVNFDPSDAAARKLFFRMPGVTDIIERDATAEQRTISGISVWCLVYNVTEADLAAGFHSTPGPIKIQGMINYIDGEWRSNIITKDVNGQDLRVYANLQ